MVIVILILIVAAMVKGIDFCNLRDDDGGKVRLSLLHLFRGTVE